LPVRGDGEEAAAKRGGFGKRHTNDDDHLGRRYIQHETLKRLWRRKE
jgi:hypothetical protein